MRSKTNLLKNYEERSSSSKRIQFLFIGFDLMRRSFAIFSFRYSLFIPCGSINRNYITAFSSIKSTYFFLFAYFG